MGLRRWLWDFYLTKQQSCYFYLKDGLILEDTFERERQIDLLYLSLPFDTYFFPPGSRTIYHRHRQPSTQASHPPAAVT